MLIRNEHSPVMFPLLHPYGHVAFQAQRGDVEAVIVDGRVVKRDHRLVGVDLAAARRTVEATVEHLRGTLGEEAWAPGHEPRGPDDEGPRQPVHVHRLPVGLDARWSLTRLVRAPSTRPVQHADGARTSRQARAAYRASSKSP